MIRIVFQKVDSSENHLKKIFKEINNQFTIYKEKKLEIDDCTSFDDYYESMRLSKNLILDYHDIFEYYYNEYHYTLILIYLMKDNNPISYYVTISVEKELKNHASLLSLRYESMEKAKKTFFRYKAFFKKNDDVLLLKEINKEIKNNEWDLY